MRRSGSDVARQPGATRPSWGFRVVARIAILLVRLVRWRVTVEGLEHVPRRGGAVLTWNHTGHVDFVFLTWDVYRRLHRQIRFLAKSELWTSPVSRKVVRSVGAVAVDRGSESGRADSFATAVGALRAGDLIGIAPEGTISPSFEPLPFRSGAVRMAKEAGVPVVPSVSWGSHRLVTYGHPFSPRRAWRIPVTVAHGEPIHVGPDDDVNEVTVRLRRATRELLHDVQERYPDGAPSGVWWVPARLGGGAPPPDGDAQPPGAEPDASRDAEDGDERRDAVG